VLQNVKDGELNAGNGKINGINLTTIRWLLEKELEFVKQSAIHLGIETVN